ncbi:hypothetical protein ACEPAF_9950 [Sanghuangporus sanghuang]
MSSCRAVDTDLVATETQTIAQSMQSDTVFEAHDIVMGASLPPTVVAECKRGIAASVKQSNKSTSKLKLKMPPSSQLW